MPLDFEFPLLKNRAITVAGGAGTASDGVIGNLAYYTDLAIQIGISANPAGGTPTLDVWVQHSMDGGVSWQDLVHAPQFTNVSPLIKYAFISGEVTGGVTCVASSDAALAANTVVQGPWGDRLRVKWTLGLAGGESGQYTLSVWVVPKGCTFG